MKSFKSKRKSIVSLMQAQASERTCRICLEDFDTPESPFITPCICTGSCKFIHLSCLRSWTDSKKQVQEDAGVKSYFWESLECEICKSPFSQTVEAFGTQVEILEIERPNSQAYMIWESEVHGASKAIHVINFAVRPMYMIGRRVSNEISISDISVSREQARVVYYETCKTVILYDLNSKFGTFQKIEGLFKVPRTPGLVPI